MDGEAQIRAAAAKALDAILFRIAEIGDIPPEDLAGIRDVTVDLVFVPTLMRWSLNAFPSGKDSSRPGEWVVLLRDMSGAGGRVCTRAADRAGRGVFLDKCAKAVADDAREHLREVFEGLSRAGVTGEVFAGMALDAIASMVHEE